MNPEERDELAALYALGMLEGEERADFERTLKADSALQDLVAEYETATAEVALSLPPQEAPDSVRQQVMAEAEKHSLREAPATRSAGALSGWIPWALAAGLAVACGLSINRTLQLTTEQSRLAVESANLRTKITQLQGEREQLQGRVNALLQEKADLEVRVASFQKRDPLREIRNYSLAPQAEAPDPRPLTALWDASRQEGVLDLTKLPAPPSDKDYQLWVIPTDSPTPVDGGILTAAVGARAVFQAPQGITKVGALAISLEPKGGSVAARGPIIYLGKM